MSQVALHTSELRSLPLVGRGKVRDNYAVGEQRLLMVATDRISAYDVVMAQTIPGKGELLTRMAQFWFDKLAHVCPNHLTGQDPDACVAADEVPQVHGRSMLVHRLEPLPIEAANGPAAQEALDPGDEDDSDQDPADHEAARALA
ncbi:MAG: phosphoribosylaminoimidazolesuccinocarboxamide synthase, partial [Burkholderiaceae bacterium]